jgi:ABC-type Fe3+/spermidine/putrescine transport system ATPase subunit
MLDPNARAAMLDTLRTIHRELGTATIHVTHEREEAWALTERDAGGVAVMRNGAIEQTGTVEELFRKPQSRFVAEFLGGANVFRATFERGDAVLAWGRLPMAEPPAFERGWVQIRPESLALVAEPGAGTVTGTVRSASDRGIYRELTVEMPDGHALRVHVAGAARVSALPGETVYLRCATPPHPIRETTDA